MGLAAAGGVRSAKGQGRCFVGGAAAPGALRHRPVRPEVLLGVFSDVDGAGEAEGRCPGAFVGDVVDHRRVSSQRRIHSPVRIPTGMLVAQTIPMKAPHMSYAADWVGWLVMKARTFASVSGQTLRPLRSCLTKWGSPSALRPNVISLMPASAR